MNVYLKNPIEGKGPPSKPFSLFSLGICPESETGNTKFLHGLSGKWSEHLTPCYDQLETLELRLGWCLALPLPPLKQLPFRRSLQTRLLLLHLPSDLSQVISSLVLQNFIHYPIILSILWDYLPKPVLQTAELKQSIKVEWLQDRLVLAEILSLVSPVTITLSLVHAFLPLHRLYLYNFLLGPMTILPLRRLYIERQIQPEMLSFVGTDEVVILFNM